MNHSEKLKTIASRFRIEGEIASIKPMTQGFINDTFMVTTTGDSPNYMLQCKNRRVLSNIPALMSNMERVTAHLRKKVTAAGGDADREVLTVLRTHDNLPYSVDEENRYWAMTLYIDDTVNHDCATSPQLAFEVGQGMGHFHSLLGDFQGHLTPVIEGLHNMTWRFNQWYMAIAGDKAHRVSQVREELRWVKSRRKEMLRFQELVDSHRIPMRAAHNNAKMSNFLFDPGGHVLCIAGLDTLMSSTPLYDFGTAACSSNCKAGNGELNLDIDHFEAFTRGFLGECRHTLSPIEKEWLPFSVLYITLEQMMAALTDYLNGDTRFPARHPEHNLALAQALNHMLVSIEDQYGKMVETVKRYC